MLSDYGGVASRGCWIWGGNKDSTGISYEMGGAQYHVCSDTEEFIPTQYNVEFADTPGESTPIVDSVTGDTPLKNNNHARDAVSIKSNVADGEDDGSYR